ncbi:hypothetical protein A3Q56_03041 [Intoshia linei]|uniref:Innexin n=1 Tax=Intoshia linei TaxID=1819745 RepID=A0A177B4K5_9BILA|nr:hypothetical protein A3Q56_03041 [Intoshia linei]
MDRLFKSLLSIKEIKIRVDDDYVDRISRQYSVIILIFFSFIVSTKQFVGTPISCWCPAQFTPSHREYTNTICWVSNTYYLPLEQTIPSDKYRLHATRPMVSYYQWVPLILMLEAVMSFIPCVIWRFLNKRSGINIATIMEAGVACQRASYLEIRDKTIRYIVSQIDRFLLAQRDHRSPNCCLKAKLASSRFCCIIGGKHYGNYLFTTYLIIKLIYAINSIGQLFLLSSFLNINFQWYGAMVLSKLITGQDWSTSNRFPRVTLCDFEIRHQSRLHNYVVQCVLTINLFNEKIFIFIWFWFVFVSIVTITSLSRWIWTALYWPVQVRYVRERIRVFDYAQRDNGILNKFTQHYLRRDGIFIIRLLGQYIGDLVAAEVLASLWNNYTPERRLLAEKPTDILVQRHYNKNKFIPTDKSKKQTKTIPVKPSAPDKSKQKSQVQRLDVV